MFKTNVCVTSDMVHKTHIKPTISVHMVNFQQKTSSWLISNISISYILSQNYIFWTRNMLSWLHSQIPVTWQPWPRSRSMRWQSAPCMNMIFFAPKLDWKLTNLGRMCWIPGKTDRKNLTPPRSDHDLADFSGRKGIDMIWALLLTSHYGIVEQKL